MMIEFPSNRNASQLTSNYLFNGTHHSKDKIFTIFKQKIHLDWIKRREDAELHSVLKCVWYVGIWFLFVESVDFFWIFFSFQWAFWIQSFLLFFLNISVCFVDVSQIDAFFASEGSVV